MKQSKEFVDREKEWEKIKAERSAENEDFLRMGNRQQSFIVQMIETLQKSGFNSKKFFAESAKEWKKTEKAVKHWEAAFAKRIKSQQKTK